MSEIVRLKDVSKHFHSKPVEKTVRNWIHKGVWSSRLDRQVYLDSFVEGGRRFVTLEAIEKFKIEQNARE
jgi:hypothetical protein